MAVIRVDASAMDAICNELKQVTLDTKEIIERYNKVLNKLDSVWTEEEQENFKCAVAERLRYMEQLTEICDNYSLELSNVIGSYKEAESSLVNDIARLFN